MYSSLRKLAFAYLRLSVEEAQNGESSSIVNQRTMITQYCEQHGIILVRVFTDDGWSGGNFDRPGFKEMIKALRTGQANMVITKDLSRLGRDMREASYYAEEYFPDHGIRYIAIADNFDNEAENILAPFQFAMNEVYLRDGSRKVKDVLRSKREQGQYCACPPYGYKKHERNKSLLIPDEMTAPVVQRIFRQSAEGDSCRTIAMELNADGVIPPLKYRVLYRDNFTDKGASYASDIWNGTTVKRILKNRVYLGHTILGKSKKPSVKSKKKVPLPQDQWVITENTHEPLITEAVFEKAQINMGRGTKRYQGYDYTRKSIFSGITVCERCGYSLCSGGTVYKGEREKYWYLSCTHQRQDIMDPCKGVRVRYADLMEVVRQDLNAILSMDDEAIAEMVREIIEKKYNAVNLQQRQIQKERSIARLNTIDKIITKLYTDNAVGKIDDERLERMVAELERESINLNAMIEDLSEEHPAEELQRNFDRFFSLARRYTHIETLDRDTLITFIERIEVGPKELPPNFQSIPRKQPYRQKIRIFYKFIGEITEETTREMSQAASL